MKNRIKRIGILLLLSVLFGLMSGTAVFANSDSYGNSITLPETEIGMKVGGTYQMKPKVTTASGVSSQLVYEIENPDVVSVDESGKIKALKYGRSGVAVVLKEHSDIYDILWVNVEFKDVTNKKAYYYKGVYWAAELGITTGYTGKKTGFFGPEDPCTRAQVVTFLWRFGGKSVLNPAYYIEFDDVPEDSYYYKAVQWAAINEITTGYSGTKLFGSDDSCTREQFVTFLYRFLGEPAVDLSELNFKDVKKSDYFAKAVVWASSQGITTGYTDSHGNPTGQFGTGDIVTRGQVATFLLRFFRVLNPGYPY
jgi:hypothetical protein